MQGTDDNDDDVHGSGVDDSYTSVLWLPMCFTALSFFHFLNDQTQLNFSCILK